MVCQVSETRPIQESREMPLSCYVLCVWILQCLGRLIPF